MNKNLALSKLLDNSLISFYWLGFILADGHLTNKRLRVVLSNKDESHLFKLSQYLETKVKYESVNNYPYIDLSNKTILSKIKEKYSISENKTTSPPNIYSISGDRLKALSIGFIDGDGSIGNLHNRPDFNIRIKVHSSWKNILEYMYEYCYINNKGYAQTTISDSSVIKKLKLFSINNKLPILPRKWNIVDMTYISKKELSRENIELTKLFLKHKISRNNICKLLNLSKSGLSLLIKRNNLI